MDNLESLIKEIVRLGLTFETYLILQTVANKDSDILKSFIKYCGGFKEKDIMFLYENKFIRTEDVNKLTILEKMFLTEKGEMLLNKESKQDNFDDFFEKWYALWPVGIKCADKTPIRQGYEGTKIKMKAFVKKHKHFDYDLIFKATEYYLKVKESVNWEYVSKSGFFISKDSNSILEGICETMLNNPDDLTDQSDNLIHL